MAYKKNSLNPFDEEDDDDIADDIFLANSRVPTHTTNHTKHSNYSGADQLQSLYERRREIEERTLNSTQKSLSVLRDSEQIGIATAEELIRQREKLERTDQQLDEINATLRFSQKHINGIKSVFGSLKNYMSGRNESPKAPPTAESTKNTATAAAKTNEAQQRLHKEFEEKLNTSYDRYETHPATRLRENTYATSNTASSSKGGSKDFSTRLDANLEEMCSNISRLKGLATDLSCEIDSQNDLIGGIIDKTELADMNINKQNKDMRRLLGKK